MSKITHEELMNLTEILITEEDDLLLPIKKLYQLIQDEKGEELPTLDEYQSAIQKDSRFKFINIPLDDMSGSLWSDEYGQKLEDHGFFHGPYVALEGEDISQQAYIELLLEKLGQVIQVLHGLYEVKVRDNNFNDGEEDRIQELLLKAESLKEQLSLVKKDLENA